MNTLTQQQINQYQWQVTDGVARAIIPERIGIYPAEMGVKIWNEWADKNEYHTNAPDGIYSGEEFELVPQTCSPWREDWRDSRYWEDEDFESLTYEQWSDYIEGKYEGNVTTRLFLRLKPSHLPAVLTTQPGEEAETVPNSHSLMQKADAYFDKNAEMFSKQAFYIAGYMQCEQDTQSTLTQKDQRIAELVQMLDQCQKGDLYFEQEIEHLNKTVSELERDYSAFVSQINYIVQSNAYDSDKLNLIADKLRELKPLH